MALACLTDRRQTRYVSRSIHLFLLQPIPLVVDELKKYIVHLLRMDEGEFTVPERPGFLSSRSGDQGVILRLQLLYGFSRIIHIEADDHHPFAIFFYPFRDRTIGGSRFHELKSYPTQPVPCDADLFRLIDIGIVRFRSPQDGLPYFPRRIQVLDCYADMVDFIGFHFILLLEKGRRSHSHARKGDHDIPSIEPNIIFYTAAMFILKTRPFTPQMDQDTISDIKNLVRALSSYNDLSRVEARKALAAMGSQAVLFLVVQWIKKTG